MFTNYFLHFLDRANGLLQSATRALIPNMATSYLVLNTSTASFRLAGAALDMERAAFLRRFRGGPDGADNVIVEQRTYFHREISSAFINEFTITNPTSQNVRFLAQK